VFNMGVPVLAMKEAGLMEPTHAVWTKLL